VLNDEWFRRDTHDVCQQGRQQDSPIFVDHSFAAVPATIWGGPLQERPPDARTHTVLCRPGGKQRPSRNLPREVAFFTRCGSRRYQPPRDSNVVAQLAASCFALCGDVRTAESVLEAVNGAAVSPLTTMEIGLISF
jgi:hypothetical protein